MNGSYKSEAVVLFRRNFSEADRILTLYTKYSGKVTAIAKGVRKPSSKKRGSLEVFSQIKFSAAKGKSLDIMTEVETIDSFSSLRSDLSKVSVAYFFVETINKSTSDSDENRELYKILIDNLNLLKTRRDLKTLRLEFIQTLLVELGYWPKDKVLEDHDGVLESVLEKSVSSRRVGKLVLT